MPVAVQSSAYMAVYQVVEALCSGDPLPTGLNGAMTGAIDGLRRADAPRGEIGLAERISVAMHRLEWAIRTGDLAAQQLLRADLQGLGSDWLETPLCAH